MPELPDITVYIEAIEREFAGCTLRNVQIRSPFLVRSLEPPVTSFEGRTLVKVSRIGKRIVWEFADASCLVFHLMIAGRFHRRPAGTRPTRKVDLATFDFGSASLLLTEASTKKRAALDATTDRRELARFERGGLDVLTAELTEFAQILTSTHHTLKRALTDPSLFDGIGNAYSDEILHAARLSPFRRTRQLKDDEVARLYGSAQQLLNLWIQRLRDASRDKFPEKVTAFRSEMAVHGRFGQPCPECQTKVQRVVYAENEMNYCPTCQTGGRVLADRSLSRLLKDDWPRTVDELER